LQGHIPVGNRVSVLIPTLNEVKNIGNIISRLKHIGCSSIFVIDGHSSDGTVERATALGAKTVVQDGHGKGGALREAFEKVCFDGDVIIVMDADGSMSPEEIPRFAEAVRNGAHVAKGSRFLPLAGSEDLTPLRRFGNKLMVIALNLLFSTNYTDLCYGFIAFRKDALTSLSPHLASDEFEIETEICIKARALGFRVDEVPSFERMRSYGKSNLNTFRDGFKIFSLLLREALKTK